MYGPLEQTTDAVTALTSLTRPAAQTRNRNANPGIW